MSSNSCNSGNRRGAPSVPPPLPGGFPRAEPSVIASSDNSEPEDFEGDTSISDLANTAPLPPSAPRVQQGYPYPEPASMAAPLPPSQDYRVEQQQIQYSSDAQPEVRHSQRGMPAAIPHSGPLQIYAPGVHDPNAVASLGNGSPYVNRSRVYAFVVDETGNPIELGSGRFAKAYRGEERWVESKTTMRRPVAIKCLQRGVR
jgi:hypothetical protein